MEGRVAVGCLQPGLQNWFPSAVNKSGAVSPATRAKFNIIPEISPRMAAGTTTVAMVRDLVAPSAIAPSLKDTGTERRNSSVDRSAIGIIITLSATPPARVEKPTRVTMIA